MTHSTMYDKLVLGSAAFDDSLLMPRSFTKTSDNIPSSKRFFVVLTFCFSINRAGLSRGFQSKTVIISHIYYVCIFRA